MRVDDLFKFIKERNAIHNRRLLGKPKPWTDDPILQQYRFTNVYREQDTVTQWIAEHWRTPHAADQYLWFALTVARFTNLPSTMEALGYPVPWKPGHFVKTLRRLMDAGQQVFTGAYMISNFHETGPKEQVLANSVLTPLWKNRERITDIICNRTLGTVPPPTLRDAHLALKDNYGLRGTGFIAGQVIADLKYVQLRRATDWQTWATPGPGSKRGLNRVMGLDKMNPWHHDDWLTELHVVQDRVNKMALNANMHPLHAQDVQNCLCEFDKYERVRLGEGRPRARYPGAA